MNFTPSPTNDKESRDSAYWAHTSTLKINRVPTGALNLNVEGRQLLSPLQGFGQLWQKTFRIPLKGTAAKPAEVVELVVATRTSRTGGKLWCKRIHSDRTCLHRSQSPVVSILEHLAERSDSYISIQNAGTGALDD